MTRELFNHLVQPWESRRDWTQLPSSFEHDAVKRAFESLKPHFEKCEIRQRIAASKATTFAELRESANGKA